MIAVPLEPGARNPPSLLPSRCHLLPNDSALEACSPPDIGWYW